jgi:protein-S-isoprenylcysteine O-methyltransferase Ste14
MQSVAIAWANLAVLVISTLLTLYFYMRSASPAALENKIGPIAYERCTRYRVVASVFIAVATLNYVMYVFYPLPMPLPRTFPWSRCFSCLIALLIALPSGYLLWRGLKDAGIETIHVKKKHRLYGGIYDKIRHPQALGELSFWWVLALLLDSPFLALYSFVWIPVFVAMCLAEERDLRIRYGKPYEEYRKRTGFFIPNRR